MRMRSNSGKLNFYQTAVQWKNFVNTDSRMATVSSSSPYHQHGGYGSPFSLGLLLEQHHNQCVPASPSLSPLFGHGPARSLAQRLASTSHRGTTSPAAAQVPELSQQQQGENSVHSAGNGSRIYSGSPLLMQILKGKFTIYLATPLY